MWWRVLGVGLVLLALGVAGGYAVGDRTAARPVSETGAAEPVPAASPAIPTPPELDILPDPTADALQPDLPSGQQDLRITKRGPGVSLSTPTGWIQYRLPNSQTWNIVPEINIKNTYTLRVQLTIGQRLDARVAKATRVAALQSAEGDGNIEGLDITAETDTSFEATYVDQGYYRVTMERWLAFPSGESFADVAVTGRSVDTEGLRDLLTRTAQSATYLEPLPPKDEEQD